MMCSSDNGIGQVGDISFGRGFSSGVECFAKSSVRIQEHKSFCVDESIFLPAGHIPFERKDSCT
mgnify:CR=1 FL=1